MNKLSWKPVKNSYRTINYYFMFYEPFCYHEDTSFFYKLMTNYWKYCLSINKMNRPNLDCWRQTTIYVHLRVCRNGRKKWKIQNKFWRKFSPAVTISTHIQLKAKQIYIGQMLAETCYCVARLLLIWIERVYVVVSEKFEWTWILQFQCHIKKLLS